MTDVQQHEVGRNGEIKGSVQFRWFRLSRELGKREQSAHSRTHYCVALTTARLGVLDLGQSDTDFCHEKPHQYPNGTLQGPGLRLGRDQRDV
jgi:hypothetical protein